MDSDSQQSDELNVLVEQSGRGPYKSGIEQRRKIMDAAIELFGTKGFMGTSMREIAKAADISQPGLLHHFHSKEELLKALLEQHEEKNAQDMAGYNKYSWQEASTKKQRSNLQIATEIKLWSLTVAEAASPDHPMHEYFIERYKNMRQLIARRIAEVAGREIPESEDFLKSAIFIAAWDGLQTQWLLDENFDMSPSFDYLLSMISRYSQYKNVLND